MSCRVNAFLLTAVLAVPAAADAQALPPTTVTIPQVTNAPRLEDYLPGGSTPGLKVTDFRQRRPKDLEPVTQPTAAYLSYDGSNVYAAFVCTQPRSDIRARMQKREDLGADDLVGIYLDTFHDRQRAYFFYSTPVGIQGDGVMSEAGGEDTSFDTQWESKGTLTDDGYVVLITVPFKVLRFPATPLQSWGVSLIRSIRSNDETAFWPGNTQQVNGFIAQFGTADGIGGVSPGRNLQLLPYGTFTGLRLRDDDTGNRYVSEGEGRVGIDVKFVPRDAVTLDFTLNPDFSQVESDEPQVTVNQRFEVFFPEKRPFFLENADFFASPITLFFSRRIRDPQVGARMTGKYGRWATGALVMDDRAPGPVAEPGSAGAGDRAVNFVGSARREFANQSNVGFFGTARDFGPSSNAVGAGSAHVRLNQNWFADGQIAGSHDTDLAGASTNGVAAFAGLVRNGRALNYYLSYNAVSPDFRVPLGFVPRTDMQELSSFLTYRWHPKSGPLTDWGPNSLLDATWNYAGELQDWIVRFPISASFKRNTNVFYRHALISETVGGLVLDQHEDLFQASTSALRWLDVNAFVAFGTRPNYYPAAGFAPFLGDFLDWNVAVTVKPVTRLSVTQTALWSGLSGREATPAAGANVFDNLLLRTRANYQFTREWSLRTIVDYQALDPNPAVVDLERSRRVVADVLLTWLAHPGTAIYAGYTDGYAELHLDPTRPPFARDSLQSTGRQVFVKASWLLRF